MLMWLLIFMFVASMAGTYHIYASNRDAREIHLKRIRRRIEQKEKEAAERAAQASHDESNETP